MNWKQAAAIIGAVAALLGLLDRFYFQKARGDVLEAKVSMLEKQNEALEVMLRSRLDLPYGPISPTEHK